MQKNNPTTNDVDPAAQQNDQPEITVLLVSDYAGGEGKAWDDFRKTLSGMAAQDFTGRAQFILVESRDVAAKIPEDLLDVLPGLRVEIAPVKQCFGTSYLLKNHGVAVARSEFVAMVDADCVPARNWLTTAVREIGRFPEAAAISGRTVYAGRSAAERILGVLSRAYLDRRGGRRVRFISNNNAVFRRSAFLKQPLPTDAGPFAARLQSEALMKAGYKLGFAPDMVVTHDFEGWAMERDIRRNIGWASIRIRQVNATMPQAWALRLGLLAIPLFFGGHVLESWYHVLRAGHHYDLPWREYPLALLTAVYVHALEIGGMWNALGHRELGATAYR